MRLLHYIRNDKKTSILKLHSPLGGRGLGGRVIFQSKIKINSGRDLFTKI